jgi:hypothetical protein
MIFSIIGTALALIGVVLIFKFGILSDNFWEHISMNSGMSEQYEKKHKIWSKIAMAFLILGLAFQLISSILQNNNTKIQETKFENLNLGIDINQTMGIKGNLKLKYENNKIFYQLNINGKTKSIDSIQYFTIELVDNDGFKISEIKIPFNAENGDITNFKTKDSLYLSVKSTEAFLAKNYLQIKKWELLARKK